MQPDPTGSAAGLAPGAETLEPLSTTFATRRRSWLLGLLGAMVLAAIGAFALRQMTSPPAEESTRQGGEAAPDTATATEPVPATTTAASAEASASDTATPAGPPSAASSAPLAAPPRPPPHQPPPRVQPTRPSPLPVDRLGI